jgi:hypothetical protein
MRNPEFMIGTNRIGNNANLHKSVRKTNKSMWKLKKRLSHILSLLGQGVKSNHPSVRSFDSDSADALIEKWEKKIYRNYIKRTHRNFFDSKFLIQKNWDVDSRFSNANVRKFLSNISSKRKTLKKFRTFCKNNIGFLCNKVKKIDSCLSEISDFNRLTVVISEVESFEKKLSDAAFPKIETFFSKVFMSAHMRNDLARKEGTRVTDFQNWGYVLKLDCETMTKILALFREKSPVSRIKVLITKIDLRMKENRTTKDHTLNIPLLSLSKGLKKIQSMVKNVVSYIETTLEDSEALLQMLREKAVLHREKQIQSRRTRRIAITQKNIARCVQGYSDAMSNPKTISIVACRKVAVKFFNRLNKLSRFGKSVLHLVEPKLLSQAHDIFERVVCNRYSGMGILINPFPCRPVKIGTPSEPPKMMDVIIGDEVSVLSMITLHKVKIGGRQTFCRCNPADVFDLLRLACEKTTSCRLAGIALSKLNGAPKHHRDLLQKQNYFDNMSVLVPCPMDACKAIGAMIEVFKYPIPSGKKIPQAWLDEAISSGAPIDRERWDERIKALKSRISNIRDSLIPRYRHSALNFLRLDDVMGMRECGNCYNEPDLRGFLRHRGETDSLYCDVCKATKCGTCEGYYDANLFHQENPRPEHNGYSCAEFEIVVSDDPRFAAQRETIMQNLAYMRNLKRCPNCSTPTSRIDGCNHIHCICGRHWCYVCRFSANDSPTVYNHLRLPGGCRVYPLIPDPAD